MELRWRQEQNLTRKRAEKSENCLPGLRKCINTTVENIVLFYHVYFSRSYLRTINFPPFLLFSPKNVWCPRFDWFVWLHLSRRIYQFILYKCALFCQLELVLIWLTNCKDQIKVIKWIPWPLLPHNKD
jgi:hypothetical protein